MARSAIALVLVALVTVASCTAPATTPETTAAAPDSAPIDDTKHYSNGRIGFDYPAEWTARDEVDLLEFHVWTEAFVGTAPSDAWCSTTSTSSASTTSCSADLRLQPGDISVEVVRQTGPPAAGPFTLPANPEPGTQVFDVDGVPARLTDQPISVMGADRLLALAIPERASAFGGTVLRAWMRGPDTDRRAEEAMALFESVRYEPALRPTAADGIAAGEAVARAFLEQQAIWDPAYLCFGDEPGTANEAVLSKVPGHGPFTKSLPAQCTWTVEGTALELWRVTWTIEWEAAFDRRAGLIATSDLIDRSGQPVGSASGGFDSSVLPYWPPPQVVP